MERVQQEARSGLHWARVATELEGNSWAAPQKQVGDQQRFPEPREGGWPRSAPGRWGRGWGGAEGAKITAEPRGTPRAPRGPHAGSQTMTTGSHPSSNKRSGPPRAADPHCRPRGPRRPPVVEGAGGGVPRPQPRAQVRGCPPRGARSAALGFRAELGAHVKLSLSFQRGTELRQKLGSEDCRVRARALFSSPPCQSSARVWLPSFPPPPRSRSPRPASPPLVDAICWGVAEGDVLFSPEAQRGGETSALEGARVNT